MRTILEETGKPASETFSEFDDAPLGSASIGQVHRAVLRADGSEVAVKVQYPEAKGLFRTDMQTIKGFMKVAAPEQLVTLGELERQFEQEFDYRQEAANLREVGANMRRHGFAPREVTVRLPSFGDYRGGGRCMCEEGFAGRGCKETTSTVRLAEPGREIVLREPAAGEWLTAERGR